MSRRPAGAILVFVLLLAAALFILRFSNLTQNSPARSTEAKVVKILAYSAFINSWGPGPWIAEEFKKRTGLQVQYQDGGDSGLLLAKLKLFPADVVLGLDQFGLAEAQGQIRLETVTAFDWAPLTFVFRTGEIDPPHNLDDLLADRFKNKISLEDPRTSSPGLQFLLWILDIKGPVEGFNYLKRLKPNLHAVSPSWSSAYGLFQKKQAALVFSYLTSPIYHWVNEKGPEARAYSSAVFQEGQPVQTEYAAVPKNCQTCDSGRKFLEFLLSPKVQGKLMQTNFMFPIVDGLAEQTEFAQTFGKLPKFKKRDLKSSADFLRNKKQLLEKWQELEL